MKQKKIIILASLALVLAAASYLYFTHCPTRSQIIAIDSYAQAADALQVADKNTLVLFDVDETLIIPADVALRSATKQHFTHWLENTLATIFNDAPHTYDYYFDFWDVSPHPWMVIEPMIIDMIASLQKRGVTVLALTFARSGAVGHLIPSYPEYRSGVLQSLDIDFNKANIPDVTFNQLPKLHDSYPLLHKGILYTNHVSKGDVLGAFLDYLQWKPNHIIFFDDTLKRIKEVAQEACARGIPYTGYHYFGADHVPGELDKEVATHQFKHLLEHEEWISDAQAREAL